MKKTVLTILGTILLGAIGSGIWDWILSDAITFAGHVVLRLFSAVFNGYLNELYKLVGNGPLFPMLSSIFTMFFMLILIFPAVAVVIMYKEINKLAKQKDKSDDHVKSVDDKLFKAKKILKFKLIPAFGMLVVIITLQIWQVSYSNSASSFIERSIDIVSTCISDSERKTLISEYRMISNANDFYKLEHKLRDISSKNSLRLPVFSSI